MKAKRPKDSLTISSDLIIPSQTNQTNTLFGGELLAKLDKVAYISACKHAGCTSVLTGAVNNVSFHQRVPLGSILTLEAKVSRAFTSSMEVVIDAWIENVENNSRIKVSEAVYTFVAVDEDSRPVTVPPIVPETELEIKRFQDAIYRRELSLALSDKTKITDMTKIKEFLNEP